MVTVLQKKQDIPSRTSVRHWYHVQSWTIPVDELKAWAENELKPKAQMALNGEGECHPGEWCQFCKAAVRCRARAEEKLRLAQQEFKMLPLLTDAEDVYKRQGRYKVCYKKR